MVQILWEELILLFILVLLLQKFQSAVVGRGSRGKTMSSSDLLGQGFLPFPHAADVT